MAGMLLYHTGHHERPAPDIRAGRKNADFGQGFYLSAEGEFAGKWARDRQEGSPVVNRYELELEGLELLVLERDRDWLRYIMDNRAGRPDRYARADVIIGPIANDTIYETYGVPTSGFFDPEEALGLMRVGPDFRQVAIKTEKAAAQLRWLGAKTIGKEEMAAFLAQARREQEEYQRELAAALEALNA